MLTPELILGSLLIVALLGLSGYFAWKQVVALRGLRESEEPREDRFYTRNQALRRLFGCVLMILLAALLAGWFGLGLHELTSRLMQEGAAAANQEQPRMTFDQRRAFTAASLYVIATLLVFLGLVLTAMLDVLAIRRYRWRHYQKINEDRRAMIERQAARLRSQRNGQRS